MDKIDLHHYESRWWSQHGEDGIIQKLTSLLDINHSFIEIGAHFHEANCLKLMQHHKWRGRFFDDFHEFKPLGFHKAWVTVSNINSLILTATAELKLTPQLGILSIDVDGNDIWLWNAINSAYCDPSIVIIECNGNFGIDKALTMPYEENHRWDIKSEVGSTPLSLFYMGYMRGYDLVYIEKTGANMFFVHNRHKAHELINNVNDLRALSDRTYIRDRNPENSLLTLKIPKPANFPY